MKERVGPASVKRASGVFRRDSRPRPSSAKTTQASTALTLLRDDILAGRILPDARLRFDDLRLQYGIGLSPLREALMRLSSEGLVILEDQRGFRVAPISRADLIDVTRSRQELECLAVRAAIARGDVQWEGNLLSTFHQLDNCPKTVDSSGRLNLEWEERHAAFHYALVCACDSPWLLKFRQMLFDHSIRYRRLAWHYHDNPRDNNEHREIMEAALARNADGACRLICQHFQKTTDEVLAGARFE